MSFGKAAQGINPEELAKFTLASMAYKKACQKITLQRLAWKRPDATDMEIAAYFRANEIFKIECRAYNTARAKYISSIRAAIVKLPNPTNDELFAVTIEANERAITEQIRKEARLASVTEEEIAIVTKAHYDRLEARTPRLTPTTDDPTCGDFEPL